MKRIKVFISSVQSEFAEERQLLFDYLTTDALLGRFFEPFIFENLPAIANSASTVYINEVEQCDIYLGLFGKEYGYPDKQGISPTEREFDHAGLHHKTRLVFLSNHASEARNQKELALIKKAEQLIVRKRFTSVSDLKSAVYVSLVRYLEEKEYIRTGPFDATLNESAKIEDLDEDKIADFVHIARSKRNFPLPVESAPETVLTHLNLMANNRLSNTAILLFGKKPQRFFITSEVKCAHFHGIEIAKPIPSYQVYKGDVFQLVNQAVDFVLSKIDVSVGTRVESTQASTNYELPRAAVSEAIVNAIAHRDYTSNGSVQVMLFKDRLEIWNPGHLPFGLSAAKLRQPHPSIPANPLLADPMYLAGYIERMGTGTGDIIRLCKEAGLKEPEFIQEEDFKTILWRNYPPDNQGGGEVTGEATEEASGEATEQATEQVTEQATEQVNEEVKRVVLVLEGEMKRIEIQEILGLKHRENFRDNYVIPSLDLGYVEMIFPDSPNHPNQGYRLSAKGIALKNQLKKSKKKMSKVGQIERATQNRVVQLFQQQLKYRYLGNLEKEEENNNVDETLLSAHLTKKGYSPALINKALFEFKKVVTINTNDDLYQANKNVYSLLRYGIPVKEEAGQNKETVYLIDWKNAQENDFAIAEEVTIKGQHNKRPDIVIYINGIALGVLELKRSTVSVSEGIRQNNDNQKHLFIKPFYTTIQLVMAGQNVEGLRYAAIETSEKYYLKWKEVSEVFNPNDTYLLELTKPLREQADKADNLLDKHIIEMLGKERLLEILHDLVVFDRGQKKFCRPNQYFGLKAAQESIRHKEGGIIWHTQGSGKSLTMVWIAKWVREYNPNARVLIITDRDELDKQIEKVFKGVDEDIFRCKAKDGKSGGTVLIEKLNDTKPWLLCSLIHKFGNKEEADYDNYLQELKNSLPKNFKPKGDFYVFVDECHRTQSGDLNKAMRQLLGEKALFIGFTGTPLMKADKQKSIEIFGKYIHTYKFDEAVKDGVVLDLRYEARDIEQKITSLDKIDAWFDSKTKGLTEFAKTELKQKWGTMKKVFSSVGRLQKIVADILLDMETRERLQNGRGNAILVSGSIYNACRYYQLFQDAGFKKCAIVTSFAPSYSDIKGEETGEGYTEKLMQYEIYQKMLNGKTSEDFEDEAKKRFIDEPAQMKLLIVVDKLLTGFDAPSATFLYIDKSMRDHGLFQAICRVNRLDGDDKDYGYIIDYKDLFGSLESAYKDFTSKAFEDYDKSDVEGLLSDRLNKGKERLDDALETIKALCEPVVPPKGTKEYIAYFCGNTQIPEDLKDSEPKRVALYKAVISLIRAYANIADEMEEAGYKPTEIEAIKSDLKHFENVRKEIQLASGDYVDLKQYEPAMRHLIDSYIGAEESKKISAFDDFSLIELIVKDGKDALDKLPDSIKKNKEAMAETIENNLRKVIIEESPTNPIYYEKMSVLLDELIKLRNEDAKRYEEYLKKIVELVVKVKKPETSNEYPTSINTQAKRALYDNLDKDEPLSIAMDAAIIYGKYDDWEGTLSKEKHLKNKVVKPVLEEYSKIEKLDPIFEVIKQQKEYK